MESLRFKILNLVEQRDAGGVLADFVDRVEVADSRPEIAEGDGVHQCLTVAFPVAVEPLHAAARHRLDDRSVRVNTRLALIFPTHLNDHASLKPACGVDGIGDDIWT